MPKKKYKMLCTYKNKTVEDRYKKPMERTRTTWCM